MDIVKEKDAILNNMFNTKTIREVKRGIRARQRKLLWATLSNLLSLFRRIGASSSVFAATLGLTGVLV